MITLTIGELAEKVGGKVDPSAKHTPLRGVASAADAEPGHLTFLGNPKYLAKVRRSAASAVLVPDDFNQDIPATPIRVDNPSVAFATAVALFTPPAPARPTGVHPTAVIHGSASLGADVTIGPHAVLEEDVVVGGGTTLGANCFVGHGSRIGTNCLIHPNVSIRERVTVGDRVIIHCGAVLGSDGYGFEFKDGRHEKIPQVGTVQVDDDVEIGANTTIDRARFGRTWIREGTKIDNLVQIAHNVVVGRHSLLVSQVGIAGSTTLGDGVTLAGQVGVVGHVEIGEGAVAGAKSGISKDLPPGAQVFGYPAEPMRDAKRQIAAVHRLPETMADLRALRQRVAQVEAAAAAATDDPADILVVLSTAPDVETARRIADTILEERLAACANIIPEIQSLFHWQGAVQREPESLTLYKTTRAALPALERRVGELHPYEVPEVIACPVRGGRTDYLSWVASSISRTLSTSDEEP